MLTKQRPSLFLLLVLGTGLSLRAMAETGNTEPVLASSCKPATSAQGCRASVTPTPNVSLRSLRLQDALDNGDLSPQEAARFLAARKRAALRHPHDSSQAATDQRGAKPHNHFWREKRRRLSSETMDAPN